MATVAPRTQTYDRSIIEGPIGRAVWRLAWPTMLQNVIAGLQKDGTALAGAGDSITAACETCHQPYRDRGRQVQGNRK